MDTRIDEAKKETLFKKNTTQFLHDIELLCKIVGILTNKQIAKEPIVNADIKELNDVFAQVNSVVEEIKNGTSVI